MSNAFICSKCAKEIKNKPIQGYVKVEGNSASAPLLCNKCALFRVLNNEMIIEIPIIEEM